MLKVSMCRQLRRWSNDTNLQIFARTLCSPATLPKIKSQRITPNASKNSSMTSIPEITSVFKTVFNCSIQFFSDLVSSVFNSLKEDFSNSDIQEIAKKIPLNSFNGLRNHIKDEIESASTVDEILSITDKNITYQESLKVIILL